jgi:hypothetical protein
VKRCTDRILVTHAGSLPRPDDLIVLNREHPGGPKAAERLRTAVAEVVAKQVALGVDVVNDGEYGKPMTDAVDYGAWSMYVYARLSGYERREVSLPDALKSIMGESRDRHDFAGYYASAALSRAARRDHPIELHRSRASRARHCELQGRARERRDRGRVHERDRHGRAGLRQRALRQQGARSRRGG